jgi:CheY-like chemotaxis protein
LAGRRVLVVEDESLVALLLEDAVLEAGGEVVGPAATLREAMNLADRADRLDAATLDLNLAGLNSAPVARLLAARRVPYVVVSGHVGEGQNALRGAAGVLVKPFSLAALIAALAAAVRS